MLSMNFESLLEAALNERPIETEKQEIINCVCEVNSDIGFMISCDKCAAWLHARCVGVRQRSVPENYVCPRCDDGESKKAKDKPEEELYVEEEEEEYPEKEEVSTSYRWPQLFIEALQALNGKGTRSEIVHWLESHYAEYLESRPTWRGNLTNLNKQGFLNKYWTREEIGVSENGRTKYLYKLIQDRSQQQRVRPQRRKMAHIDSSSEDLGVPASVMESKPTTTMTTSPTEKNITWTGIVREALLSLGNAKAEEIAKWVESHYEDFIKKKGENWKTGPLRSGINNSLGVHWSSEIDPITKRKVYRLIEQGGKKKESKGKRAKIDSDSDSDGDFRPTRPKTRSRSKREYIDPTEFDSESENTPFGSSDE